MRTLTWTIARTPMWLEWLDANIAGYWDRGKLVAPDWLGPPAAEGFKQLPIASQEGQVADWALALSDGSRVHVQEFPDGRRVVHRDKYDPGHSLVNMVAHLLLETPWGRMTAVGGLLYLAARSQ
jgi:hypothetical protein